MAKTFEILVEPRGPAYEALLDFAEQRGSTFSLVWRGQLFFAPGALELRERLESSLVREETASSWPGTQLFDTVALIGHYRLDAASHLVLAEAGGLYSWLAPERAEDLAMYRDGACWLASVAHEAQSWMEADLLSPEELGVLNGFLTGRLRGGGRTEDREGLGRVGPL